jgi:hypothetical protein
MGSVFPWMPWVSGFCLLFYQINKSCHVFQADQTHLQLLLQPSLTSWLQQPGATAELLWLPMALAAAFGSATSSSSGGGANTQSATAAGGLSSAVAAAAELMGATAGPGGATAGWRQQLLRLAVSHAVLQLCLSLVR